MVLSKEKREIWFRNLGTSSGIDLVHPLIGVMTFDTNMFSRLQNVVFQVLCDSSSPSFMGERTDFLYKFEQSHFSVDTTAGSVAKISYKNFISYADLHRQLCSFLRKFHLIDMITGLSNANPRLVPGKSVSNEVETRSYSTTKIHIDPWAGEPDDVVQFWIPLFGDTSNTTMQMFAPPDQIFSEEWLRPLDDYNYAQGLVTEGPLNIELGPNQGLIFDGACPHQTTRGQGGARVSLDGKFTRENLDPNVTYPSVFIGIEEFTSVFG